MIKIMKVFGVILGFVTIFEIANVGFSEYKMNRFPDTQKPITQLKKFNKDQSKLTVLIFHKEGCRDCKSVVRLVNKELSKNRDNVNYVVVSTNSQAGKTLIHEYGVYKVPTFILFNHNHEISRYEDTERSKISKIMKGQKLN